MLPLPQTTTAARLTGTSATQWQLGQGPILAVDPVGPPPLGALAAYDAAGLWYVPVRVADAELDADAVNLATLKRTLDAAGIPAPPSDAGLFEGGRRGGLYG